MPTLAELHSMYLRTDPADKLLFEKVVAAVFVTAEAIRLEADSVANHANRAIWARQAFQHASDKAAEMWVALLAANEGASLTTIRNATDAAIKNNVAAAVNIFAVSS